MKILTALKNIIQKFTLVIENHNFQAILKKTNYKRPSLEGQSVRYSSEINELPQVDTASRSKDYKNELNQKLSKATKTELLPGIMLEGSSYDL